MIGHFVAQKYLDYLSDSKKAFSESEEPPKAFEYSVLRALLNSGNDEIQKLFTRRTCQPGEIIMQENDAGDSISIIAEGSVVIFKGALEDPVILGYRTTGDLIGEMALLDHRPRSATVLALEPTVLLVTNQDGFNELLSKPPFIGLNLLENLTSRLRESDDRRSQSAREQHQLTTQVSTLETEKKHLLELHRLRQEMTDLIVHDLRNPLGSIIFSVKTLQMLLPEDIGKEHQELMNIALSASGRMQRLVDSMLEVSRMESGQSELVLTKVDLGSFINQIVQTVAFPYKQSFTLEVAIEPDLPIVSMDRDKIDRVFANLLDNAIKHTPKSGKIEVKAELVDHEVHISVSNDGPLIPPEERERIFEKFAQVSGEKRKQRGFGLGLVYCRLTVEAHGGRIWVEPGANDNGSRFTFSLPIQMSG